MESNDPSADCVGQVSGEKIHSERLKILPFAIYCRDCQEKREELEAAERVRL